MTRLRLSLTITFFTLAIFVLTLTACVLSAGGGIASPGMVGLSTHTSTQPAFTPRDYELD